MIKYYAAAFASGVLIHLSLFRRGEWNLHAYPILQVFVAAQPLLAATVSRRISQDAHSLWAVAGISSVLSVAALSGLFTSILIYRGAFHRLNQYPGPFFARLSNLYITLRASKKLRLFEEVQQLHTQYGDFVRLGPSELSTIDPRALQALHSSNSPCSKGPWYSIEHPTRALQMTRDKEEHARRRKAWDLGFSLKAMKNYEVRVSSYTAQLMERLEESKGTVIDATLWFSFYSFDVMGDLAFGRSFGMLKEGTVHPFMKLTRSHMLMAGSLSHLVWILPLLKKIPLLNRENIKFREWLRQQVIWRQQNTPDVPDVFSWILSDYNALENPTSEDLTNLYGDAQLIAVAGSDTTATSLSCLFLELAINKRVKDILRDEFTRNRSDCSQPSSLLRLPYLQACINEVMRLYPAIPSGLQRVTPPEGLQIGDVHVPGETIITVPTYTLNRDPRFYVHPNDFIPERWTTRPELTKDPSLFVPFSIGRYSCVGKQLALMEIRSVVCRIMQRFDVTVAHEDVPQNFRAGLQDGFTLAAPTLRLLFTEWPTL
ncbi:cytochrome P450 family 628 [Microdochium nivale]|nr:cytochrome P450 family 628 [Microdochium nivale]